jgi:tether containing UBX domain for GLUT4
MADNNSQPSNAEPSSEPSEILSTTTSRPLSVYRPPSRSTPSAALTTHNEADYTPTVEHAQIHQKLLNNSTRNVRLLTDSQLAEQAAVEAEKYSAIKDVEIKIRFPDQSAITSKFGQEDTGATLYRFVRDDCLAPQFKQQPFVLRNPGIKPGGTGDTIPDSDEPKKKLIQGLLLKGRVLVVFEWADSASLEARGARSVLKEELRAVAAEMKVEDLSVGPKEEVKGVRVDLGKGKGKDEGDGDGSGAGGLGKKMPKWLKGLAKK